MRLIFMKKNYMIRRSLVGHRNGILPNSTITLLFISTTFKLQLPTYIPFRVFETRKSGLP